MRAMSRRTSRMRGRTFELVGRRLETQVELLALQIGQISGELIVRFRAEVLGCGRISCQPSFASQMRGVTKTGNDLGLDRQLHRRTLERLGGQRAGNAVELEQDPARLHPSGPVFDRTLALALADFGRLLRNRNVREHADPQTPLALDVARDGPTGRFDLPCGDALRLKRLEAVRAEVQLGTALGVALDPALEGLAELVFFSVATWCLLYLRLNARVARRRSGPPS